MRTNSSIRDSYHPSDKIYLGAFNLKRPLLIPFLLSLVVLSLGNLYLLNQNGVTIFTLGVSAASFCLLLISAFLIRNLMAEAYLKQDNFVVKYVRNNQAKVMCVKCVRRIQTYRILGIYMSFITFKLDGKKHKAMVVGSPSRNQSPKQLILQAKNLAA